MTSLSKNLETSIHRTLDYANARGQKNATLEHFLLALIDDPDAASVIRACSVDLDQLRIRLVEFVDPNLEVSASKSAQGAQPTNSFQRVVQRAIVHVQTSGREEVNSANVLVGIMSEGDSQAAKILHELGMTRFNAVQYIAHGIAKAPVLPEPNGTTAVGVERSADAEVEATKVMLLNDDHTPMVFVVDVLERYFDKKQAEARRIMLDVHVTGVGLCGVYPYHGAKSKVTQVMDFSRQHSHPLQCTMEKE